MNQWLSEGSNGDGTNGGVVYDAQGVDTDIYFSGATPSVANPIADGYIRAPGAGGKGTTSNAVGTDNTTGYGGNNGGGGAGRPAGIAGNGGIATSEQGNRIPVNGGLALNGDIIGNGGDALNIPQSNAADDGGDWGQDTSIAIAGSGVIDSGATVVFFGDTPTRYINGNGDH